jgi:hypothetical protein
MAGLSNMWVAAVFIVLLVTASCHAKVFPKALSGAPSEFASHVLPAPLTHTSLVSAMFVDMSIGNTTAVKGGPVVVVLNLPVDTPSFTFVIFSSFISQWSLALVDPNGAVVDLSAALSQGTFPLGGDNGDDAPASIYTLTGVTGVYTLTISTNPGAVDPLTHKGYVHLFTQSAEQIASTVSSYALYKGTQVGLQAYIFDGVAHPFTSGQANLPPIKIHGVGEAVTSAQMTIDSPDGDTWQVPMHDDGLHGDLLADDGIYGATFNANQPGLFGVQSRMTGKNAQGTFERSVQHLVQVVEDTVTLTSNFGAQVMVKWFPCAGRRPSPPQP